MLNIKDLSATQELDSKAMTAVRGGGDVYSSIEQKNIGKADSGFVSVVEGTNNLLSENNAIDTTFKLSKTDITNVAAGQHNKAGVFGF
jgi:hypothetical protein